MNMASLHFPSPGLLHWLQGPGVGRLVLVVNLLLVLGLTWLLAQLTWQLLLPAAPEPITPLVGTAVVAPVQSPARGGEVARLHLFGEAVVGAESPVEEVPRDAPDTRLRLTLRGLFAAQDPEQALAIVADPGGDEKAYRIGDPLPGGAELREIYADRVILSRAGRYETLRLPQEDPIDGVSREPTSRPAAGGAVSEDPGALLQQHRETLRTNPQSLISLVRPMPVQENGQLVGFRLLPGTEPGFLNQLGLRAGDIVTAINGLALDNPANGLQALQALQNATSVNLEIRRGQQNMTLNFDVPQ
jgi:general secretion pathway protein C